MSACECGMTLEGPGARAWCEECGTGCCRSCALEVAARVYCRWCATSRGHAA